MLGLVGVLRARYVPGPKQAAAHALLRKAYGAAPDDPVVSTAFAAGCRLPVREVSAVAEHVYRVAPWRAVGLLQCSVLLDLDDEERWALSLERLRSVMPERVADFVYPLVKMGREDDAKEQAALSDLLGDRPGSAAADGGSEDEDPNSSSAMVLLEPKKARAVATRALGNPKWEISTRAWALLVNADLMAGRISPALSELVDEIERQRGAGGELRVAELLQRELRIRRRFGLEVPDTERFREADRRERARPEDDLSGSEVLAVELLLARRKERPPRADAERRLAILERRADQGANGDPKRLEFERLVLLPLVRAVRGDAAAARLWKDAMESGFVASAAFDAGLAAEAVGDRSLAISAYRAATDPYGLGDKPFEVIAARFRLAALYRAEGKLDEAKKLEAIVDRVWADADPGLRDKVKAMK
jgi:hypothetical protein